MVFSAVDGGEPGGNMLSPSLPSVSLRISGLDLEQGIESEVELEFESPGHLGALMGSG